MVEALLFPIFNNWDSMISYRKNYATILLNRDCSLGLVGLANAVARRFCPD